MIEARELSKVFNDKKRGAVRAVDRRELPLRARGKSTACSEPTAPARPPRCACWPPFSAPPPARPASPGSTSPRSAKSPRAHRFSFHRHRAVRPPDRRGNGGIFRPALTASIRATLRRRIDELFKRLDMEEFRRPPLRQALHRHEAESFHRPHPGARSAGDDLRRAHQRPGRHGRAHHHRLHSRVPRARARP